MDKRGAENGDKWAWTFNVSLVTCNNRTHGRFKVNGPTPSTLLEPVIPTAPVKKAVWTATRKLTLKWAEGPSLALI